MNIDSITLQVITHELQEALIGGQISKIYQPDIRTLYFRIFNTPKTYHLIITLDITPRIYLSSVIPPMPDMPSALCMFLRKYYENGRIASIEQLYLDRLLSIDIDILNAAGKLITRTIQIELMGKYSNVIFTENNIILEALIKTKRNTTALRTIAPKEPYGFPPNAMRMNPFSFTSEELADMMPNSVEETLGRWLLRHFNGMSTILLNELTYRTGIDHNKTLAEISLSDRFTWCRAIEQMGIELKQVNGVYVYKENEKTKELIFPLLLQCLSTSSPIHVPYVQTYLNKFQESCKSLNGEQRILQKIVQKRIEKQKKKIHRMQIEMEETTKMDVYREYGDLLMIYASMPWQHQSYITVDNILHEPVNSIKIPINPACSLTENANKYYKKYTKLRHRKRSTAHLQEENEMFLTYLYSLDYALETVHTKAEIDDIKDEMKQSNLLEHTARIKTKKKTVSPIFTIMIDNIPLYIGHNNRQNDYLTGKKAHPYDLWFHAKNIPGSHVILACHDVQPTVEQIEKAAQMAAFCSQGKKSSKVEVDCTLIKYVKKMPHAVPGLVTFSHQKTYLVEPKDISLHK